MAPPFRRPRARAALAAAVAVAVAGGGCGRADPAAEPTAGPASTPVAGPVADPACTAFERYGDLTGTTVSITETTTDAGPRIGAFGVFESCTGARVQQHGAASVAEQVQAGQPPDLAYVPGSAALAELVRLTGAAKPAPPPVAVNVAEFYPETYRAAGSVDGTLYAAPLDGVVKSLVWYSPRSFAARGYPVPSTWDDLTALSQRIVADGGTPWCAGAAAGPSTGWPLVDWLEDSVLRTAGPEVFDAWVSHAIPADAPQIGAALDDIGTILRNGAFVNGGIGDPASIATTSLGDGGVPIVSGSCFLHRQADDFAASWPAGTGIGENGDVFVFRMPPRSADAEPTALAGGGFVVAFSDRREVQALQAYLSTPDWAKAMAGATRGRWVSPNSGLDPATVVDPVSRVALGVLQDPRMTIRYDGSDRMPAVVGSTALPQAMTAWVTGTPTADALAAVEASWPRQ